MSENACNYCNSHMQGATDLCFVRGQVRSSAWKINPLDVSLGGTGGCAASLLAGDEFFGQAVTLQIGEGKNRR